MIQMLTLIHQFAQTSVDPSGLPNASADSTTIKAILDVVFATLGALAVLIISVSGLRYITANGDSNKISQAKNGIIYALIGLAVAVSAAGIVNFVIGNI